MKKRYIRYPQTARSFAQELNILSSKLIQENYKQPSSKVVKVIHPKYSYYLRNTYSTDDSDFLARKEREKLRQLKKQISDKLQKSQSKYKTKNFFIIKDQKLEKTQAKQKKLQITDFSIIKLLGKGKYGKTCVAKHKATNFLCAIKIISKVSIKNDQKVLNQTIRELKIHSFLSHPNIIDLYGFFDDQDNIYLIEQLGSSGSVYQLIKKKKIQKEAQEFQKQIQILQSKNNKKSNQIKQTIGIGLNKPLRLFHQETIAVLMKELLLAINFMHKRRIIHRDLKPQNIVVTHGTAKICDIGLAVYCQKKWPKQNNTASGINEKNFQRQNQMRETICGTPVYMPPQIVLGVPYDEKVDIWSIGTLSYELLTGEDPFRIRRLQDLQKILNQKLSMKLGSNQFREFVRMSLNKNWKARSSAQQLIQCSFIEKYRNLQTAQELCDQKPNGQIQVNKRKHQRSLTAWQQYDKFA